MCVCFGINTHVYKLHIFSACGFSPTFCREKPMSINSKPLPPHFKHTAYLEISRTGSKYICTLIDGDKRTPVRMFKDRLECLLFASGNGLDFSFVGGAI